MINNVTVVGRLTKTPELRYTPGGNAVTNFTVACNKPKKDGQDQGANFVECVTWGKSAENLCNYQKKGNLIGATGHIQSRSYEANDGRKVYVQEVLAERVQFLEFNGNSQGNDNTSEGAGSRYNRQAEANSNYTSPFGNEKTANPFGDPTVIQVDDDSLPF